MCGQERPDAAGTPLTPRELDVLIAWWVSGTVKQAARDVGVGEQRAKNLLARARIRSRVHTNAELLAVHMDEVRTRIQPQVSQNIGGSAVA